MTFRGLGCFSYLHHIQVVDSGNLLRLPELLRGNQNALNVISLARSRREAQSAHKHVVEREVRLCEENLRALQQELLDTNRSLQEVDSYISALRATFQQTRNVPLIDPSSNASSANSNPPSYPLYESEPSEDSGSIRSCHPE